MSNIPANAIQIPRPAPKAVSEVQVPPKAYLNFQFSLQGASSTKQGDDLIVEMPDGSKVVCLGYYSNNAEGDRPQIAVNGEALPPSALDLSFFSHEVEGVRPEGQRTGQPEGAENGLPGQEGKQGQQAGADAKAPASSGATATGESATSTDGTAQAAQNAGASGSSSQTGQTGQAGQSSGASSSASSSGSGSSGSVNDGGFKQDLNVDFLGGINRLPGLDLGSNRGFENTDIVGSPTGGTAGGIWGGIIGNNGSTTTPAPETPPFIPADPAPPAPSAPPVINIDVAGLREQGFDADKNPVGNTPADATVSHSLTVTLPAGMDASFVKLNVSLANGTLMELAPGADFSASYGDFSYTVTDKLDASGNPFSPPQVEITFAYKNLDNSHTDIDGLQLGESAKDSLHYEVTVDGDAGTSGKGNVVQTGDVNITIEGSNDGPVLKPVGDPSAGLVGHGEVKEEGVFNDNRNTEEGAWGSYDPDTDADQPDFGTHKNETRIQLGVNDADTNDSHTYTLTQADNPSVSIEGLHEGATAALVKNPDGSYTLTIDGVVCGTLTLSPTGEMVFTLDSAAATIQAMKAGETSTLTVNVTVTDRGGLSDSGDVTVTIHGTNDRPTLAVVKNDGDTHITLTEKGADVAITESGDKNSFGSVSGSVQGADNDTGDSFTYHLVSKGTSVEGKDKLEAADLDADNTIVGNYGTLVLQPDGTYTYTENGTLKGGESKSETFTVLVKDENGAFTTKELTFEVTGKYYDVTVGNQPPAVTVAEDGVQNGGNKPEAGSPDVSGNVARDADGNPTFTDNGLDRDVVFSFKLAAQPGTDATVTEDSAAQTQTFTTQYGTLVFNMADGTYTYTLHTGADTLGINDRLTESFTVKIYKDGSLVDSELRLDVNIQGTNDKPELKVTEEGGMVLDEHFNGSASLVESGKSDDPTTIEGKLSSDDVDTGDKAGLTYHVVVKGASLTDPDVLQDGYLDTDGVVEGDWGTLKFNADGTFTYTENGKLTSGQPGTDTFTVLVKDEHGAFSTKELTFNVRGSYNDVVFTDATHDVTVQEPGVKPGGNIDFAGTPVASGNILKDSDGNSTFTDSDGSAVTRVYTLESTDPDATSSIDPVTGKQTITTTYGTLVFDTATGEYTYTITNPNHPDIHKLLSSESLTEHFTLQVTKDGNTVGSNLTVEVKIQGSNDMPTITVTDEGGVTVDSAGNGSVGLIESGRNAELGKDPTDTHNSVSGKLAAGDADAGDTHTFHIVNTGKTLGNVLQSGDLDSDGKLEGRYGTLVLDKTTGQFTYTENGKLGAGATGSDTFTVLVKDKDGAFVTKELTFNVTGENNKLEVGADNYAIDLKESGVQPGGNTPEAGKLEITGNVKTTQGGKANIIDDDANPSQWSFGLRVHADDAGKGWTPDPASPANTVSYTTAYGTLVFNILTGDYTYTLRDGTADHLPQGTAIKEKFVVTVSKAGQADVEQDFVINIAGANDAPDIRVTQQTFTVTEDATAPTQGTATNTDVDDGDTHSYSIVSGTSKVQVMSGTYGILRIDPATGKYTYELDNSRDATQQLGRGEHGEEKFTLRVTDKNGAFDEIDITVTVNGALDTPTVSYQHGVVTEDGGLDADGNEVGLPGFTVEGSASIGAVDTVHKGTGKYEIVGADGNLLGPVDAAGMQTITTANGELVFNTHTGAYTYTMNGTANAAHQYLNINDILALDTFNVRATFPNANGGNTVVNTDLVIDIKGINDAPEFTNSTAFETLSITRTHPLNEAPKTGSTATAEDVDNKDLGDAGVTADTSELTFCFKVTINGKVEYVQSIKTDYGSVTINAQTGVYEYSLNNVHSSVRGLQLGQSLNDNFTIVVRDPHGAEDSHVVNVTINGIDDSTGPDSGHDLPALDLVVKEDSGGTTQRPGGGSPIVPGQEDGSGNGAVNPDAPRYAFKGADGGISLSMQGKYGTIYIDACTGKYRYVLDNQHSAVQMLAAGQLMNEFFNVHAFKMESDGTITWLSTDANPRGTIKVTVEGANDAPELNHENMASGIQVFGGATGISTSGKFQHENIDMDATDKPRFNLDATYAGEASTTVSQTYSWGTVTLNTLTGEYTYKLTSVVTSTVTEKFTVYVSDNHGGVVSEEVSITITPANARPVIVRSTLTEGFDGDSLSHAYGENPNLGVDTSTGDITLGGAALPDGAAFTAGVLETTTNLKGSFAAWDYEVDVSHTASAAGYKFFLCDADGSNLRALDIGGFGTLELGLDGKFTFTLNNKNAVVMGLKEGELHELNYHVVVRDANGVASGVEDFTITVVGANNQPVVTVDTANITMFEDQDNTNPTVGNITLTDPDLDAAKQHDFDLSGVRAQVGGTSSTLTIEESVNAGRTEYSFTVKDGSGVFGVFKVLMDSTDPTKATYWFEVDPSVAGRLGAADNVTLEFKLTFDDGQIKNSTSEGVEINVTIQGKEGGGVATTSLALPHDDALPAADDAVDHTGVVHHAQAAPELASDQVGALGAPDTTLPGNAPEPLAGQGGGTGASPNMGANTGAGAESGPAQPITLETPLDHAPLPDMTSAPGQESLQFQLQTTGV